MKPRAVLYARVSTAMQERDGVSLDAQLAMARTFCESRGLELSGHYVDTMSGTKDDRPGLARLEADLAARAFDFVIVYKLDRLSRSAAHYHALLQRMEAAGANLASLTQPFDGTTSIGRFMLAILIAAAELEVDTTAERIKDSIRYRVQQGRVIMGRYVPLGYDYHHAHTDAEGTRHPGRLTINVEEAAVVRWIFERYHQGATIHRVTQDAAELGIKNRGKPLQNSTIQRILRRTLYKGELETLATSTYRRGGKKVTTRTAPEERVTYGGFPAIVEPEVWDAVAARLSQNAAIAPRLVSSSQLHPWSGIVRCDGCGGRLSRDPSKTGVVYRCRKRSSAGADACPALGHINERDLYGIVAPAIFKAVSRATMAKRARGQAKPAAPPPDTLTSALADIEARRERVQDMYEQRDLTREKYRARMDKLDAESAELRARLTRGPEGPPPLPPVLLVDLADAWHRLAERPAERVTLLGSLVESIRVTTSRDTVAKVTFRPYQYPGWPEALEVAIPYVEYRHGGRGVKRGTRAPG